MTTIVAVRKNGIVAIAADTLTTFGNTRLPAAMDSSHDKILHLGDSHVGVCGSAAHHLVLANLLSKSPDIQLNSKEAIFETFRKLHPVLKEECFLNPKEDEEDPYESSQITALIINASGLYGIFSMREVFESTHSTGLSVRATSLHWVRCSTPTRVLTMRSTLPAPGSKLGLPSTKTAQLRLPYTQ
jgi:ATP-dependent HslUV protease subunit HslV